MIQLLFRSETPLNVFRSTAQQQISIFHAKPRIDSLQAVNPDAEKETIQSHTL